MNAFRSQLLLLWRLRHVQRMYGFLAVGLLLLWFYGRQHYFPESPQYAAREVLWSARMLTTFMSCVGLVWALAVWRGESPAHRDYHWSLPVDIRRHDFYRVCAAAVWLLSAITIAALYAALANVTISVPVELVPQFWWNLYTAALIPFLIVSAIALTSRNPGERVAIGLIVIFVCSALAMLSPSNRFPFVIDFLVGRAGLTRALIGWFYLGESGVHNAARWSGYGLEDPSLFVLAAAVWLAIGLCGVVIATFAPRRSSV